MHPPLPARRSLVSCPHCCGFLLNLKSGKPCDCEDGYYINPLLDADYAAIEARIVCWLAGQEDALEEYRQGVDRYKLMASFIYRVPVEEVNKHPQRFVGKQTILGCGFGMGPKKYRMQLEKFGYHDLPMGMEFKAVDAFRRKHYKVKNLWGDISRAAFSAILNKGSVYTCGKLAFMYTDIEGFPFLLMKLPSGRKLAYPRAEIKHGELYVYRKTVGVNWAMVETGGCTLVENATQAVAADIMANGTHNAEAAGYQVATLIHDQALAYYQQGQTPEEFCRLLTDLPPWADGLPIEAEGSLAPFYKKD